MTPWPSLPSSQPETPIYKTMGQTLRSEVPVASDALWTPTCRVSTGEGSQGGRGLPGSPERRPVPAARLSGRIWAKTVRLINSALVSFAALPSPVPPSPPSPAAVSSISSLPLAKPLEEWPLRLSRQCPSTLKGLQLLAPGAQGRLSLAEPTLRSSYF